MSQTSKLIARKQNDIKILEKELEQLELMTMTETCKDLLKKDRQDKIVQFQSEIKSLEAQVKPEIEKIGHEIRIIEESKNNLVKNEKLALQKLHEYFTWHFESHWEPRDKVYLRTSVVCSHNHYDRSICGCNQYKPITREMSQDEIIKWLKTGDIKVKYINYRYQNVISSTFYYYNCGYNGNNEVTSLDITYELLVLGDGKPKVYRERY
jgi:hypothetical protein